MYADVLASRQLTRRLHELLRDEIDKGTPLRVPRNAHVYNSGESGAELFFVEDGHVKTMTYSPSGKSCLLSIYTPGDVFGEFCLHGGQRLETAAAMRSTALRRIPAAAFCNALADAHLLEAFLGYLVLRMSEQQQLITNLVTMDSERRLAAVLLILAQKLGRRIARGTRIEQQITHEELSCMVGTTRSRVGYFLKRFGNAGLVRRMPGRLLVIDEGSLASYLASAT